MSRKIAAALGIGAMMAWTTAGQAPPPPGPPPDGNPVMYYALGIGLLLLVGFASFKPSKRGHQD